jgi:hypothetical protein
MLAVFPRRTRALAGAFASHSLSWLWNNEYVPAYKCPDSHPWLLNKGYAPGVSTTPDRYANGPATGFPNPSATSWSLGTSSYQVRLHCTNQVGAGCKD